MGVAARGVHASVSQPEKAPQVVAHRAGVEAEQVADIDKRERPFTAVIQKPVARFDELPAFRAAGHGGIAQHAADRVFEHRRHQVELGTVTLMAGCGQLRRKKDFRLAQC